MATPHQFYLSVIGRGYSEGYGYQCVAGFKEFCKQVLGLNLYGKPICYGGNPSGFAYRIWYNFDSLGLGKYFEKVPANQMVDGDWAIWNYRSGPCPQSHIAMFRKDCGATGIFLGQNQTPRDTKFTQVNISYNGLMGGLRPKIYHQPVDTRNYINIPPTIEARNVYNMKQQVVGQIKPKKFGGLSYYVYRYVGEFAEIQTSSFGRVLVKKTASTPITIGYHTYNKGSF